MRSKKSLIKIKLNSLEVFEYAVACFQKFFLKIPSWKQRENNEANENIKDSLLLFPQGSSLSAYLTLAFFQWFVKQLSIL